jgi:hypothetical protein
MATSSAMAWSSSSARLVGAKDRSTADSLQAANTRAATSTTADRARWRVRRRPGSLIGP